jgi:hypothetical protein
MYLFTDIANHRLGAFVYGFLSGVGLILIIWGVASIVLLPSRNFMLSIGLTLLGVGLFAGGSCREAYLRSDLPRPTKTSSDLQPQRVTTTSLISEQIVKDQVES